MSAVIRWTVRKELKEMRRDRRLIWASGIALALLLVAVGISAQHCQTLARQKAQATAAERARWLGQGENNPHGAAHYGIYVFKPQTSLMAFDPGIETFVGASVWLEAHKQNEFVYRPAQDAAPVQRFVQLSPAAAVQILGPLLIILLGFGALAGEREQGTLRQILSQGADGPRLLTGKALALAAVLLAILAPAAGAALMSGLTFGLTFSGLRLLLMVLAYALYLGAFLFLTLAVSAWTASARSALVILLAFWAVNCFLAPRAVAELAETVHPLPSSVEWKNAMQTEMAPGHAVEVEERLKAELLQRYGVRKEEDLPVNWRGILLQQGEEANYPIFDKHYNRLFEGIRGQDGMYQWGAMSAPLLALQSLSMGLAGSDSEHHRRFVVAAEEHRRVIQKTVNDELSLHPEKDWGDYQAGPDLWARVPAFHYEPPPLSSLLWHYVPAAFLLSAWFLVAAWLALRAGRDLRP
ncbi:MAG: DUF3526 domain-containing protein [Gammaproteobacteria bacterium]